MKFKRIKVAKYSRERFKKDRENSLERHKSSSHGVKDNIGFVLGEVWRNYPAYFFAMLAMPFAVVLENLCAAYTDKYVVSLVTGERELVYSAIICAALIAGARIFRHIGNACGDYGGFVGSRYFDFMFVRRFWQKNMSTDYENNEKTTVNDTLQKARSLAGYIQDQVFNTLQRSVSSALNVFAFGTVLSFFSPWLIPIIVIPAVACYYINRRKMIWIWNMADNWQTFERQLDYVTRAGMDFSYAKDVRIYGMQGWFRSLFDRSFGKRMEWFAQQDVWEARHDIAATLVSGLGDFAAYALVIYSVAQGQIDAGEFILFFNSIGVLSGAVRTWCDNYSGYKWLSENISYVRDYYEMKDKTNREKGEPVPTDGCEIEFRNVSYTYYKAEEPTLKNISFTLHKGEKLALVGLNGAGKTTLIKLMCGLYDPTEGEILLNGKPVNSYNREEYFKVFSTVFQDISMLPVSVAENITGEPPDKIDREAVYDCLKKAGLYDKIMSLPEKEDTPLVKSVYENATEFSGGEAQKLALAKALYKNAPVLLLDEPTAALDPIAEQKMYLSYAQFSKGRSSVFISHRLASTRFCDRIFMLENGSITEEGTHSELMRKNGKYAELFRLQSSYYNDEKDGDDLEK